MKDKKKILVLLALLLLLCTGVGSAWAYFTDQVVAEGGFVVEAGKPNTKIEENVVELTKYVTIANTGEIPLYIRVRAFCGDEYKLQYQDSPSWELDGEWYYYTGNDGVLDAEGGPNDKTSQLLITVLDKDGNKINISQMPEKDKERFNVVVVWERLALQYDENGELVPTVKADWGRKITGGDE